LARVTFSERERERERGEREREREREKRERERVLLTLMKWLKVRKHNALKCDTASGRTGSSI
jgi:hypothetical protein